MTTPISPVDDAGQVLTSDNTSSSFAMPNNAGSSTFPSSRVVENFHRNSDVNRRPEAFHHTLGTGHNQAAYGDHTHDGSTGRPLFNQTDLFNKNLGTYQGQKDTIKQILGLLARLGAIDSTTVLGNWPEILTGRTTVTWTSGSPSAASDIMALTFNPAFSVAPMFVAMIRITTTPTNVMSVRQTGSITASGVSIQIASTVALASGSSCAVDWIAVNMRAYT